jgi:hypothetical protein
MDNHKQQALNSVKILNEILFNNAEKIKIRNHGRLPTWKIVYLDSSAISESFKSWQEVRIFLAGMRRGIAELKWS